jgi:hypothetical protein
MIAGHGRHGKDTVCEILRDDYGMTFESSSQAASDYFIYHILGTLIGYETSVECYEDRHNHRALWFELIKAINYNDPTTLGRVIYKHNDIYCGIRNITEFDELEEAGLFDVSIWVDGSKRHPPESDKSCTVTSKECDIILDNNGTLEDLKVNISKLMKDLNDGDSYYARIFEELPTPKESNNTVPYPG